MNQIETAPYRLAEDSEQLLKIVAGAGAVLVLAGCFAAPERAWTSLLMAGYLLVCLGLAGLFFVAVQFASGAAWSAAFRRIPEAMSLVLPYGAAILGIFFLFGSHVYPWRHESEHFTGFKGAWLSYPFFLGRAVLFLGLWYVFTRAIVRASRRGDERSSPGPNREGVKLSVIFLVVFAMTFWLASFDWIMSLEPHWASTIFGIYNFAGMFSSGLAVMILLLAWMRRSGPLYSFITPEHFHDLGKLLFGFTTFWMYIWFSQYMLIWYANIPEETVHYLRRQYRFWEPLFLANMFLNWVIPFTALLPRWTKRDPAWLSRIALVVVLGRLLDLYLMIHPAAGGAHPSFGLWELGALALATALFVLVFVRAFREALPVPVGDVHLAESLHYHN